MRGSEKPAFISYSRDDSRFAMTLAQDLKAAGAAVWLDQLDIEPGMEWDDAIEAALQQADRFLIILSPSSASSRNVRNEIAFALDEQKIIVPIMHRDCTVPLQLRRVQHVEFRKGYTQGLDALLKAMDSTLVPPPDAGEPQLVLANPQHSPLQMENGRKSVGRWMLNPGFTLNVVSILLLALILSVFIQRFLHPSAPINLKDVSLLIPLLVALGKSKRSDSIKTSRFRLTPSFESGLYGGLIGGSLSGLLIGLPYFFQYRNFVSRKKIDIPDRVTWSIVPESVLYSALIGLAVGAATQYLIGWFRHLVQEDRLSPIIFNDLTGGVLGGVLAGLVVGAEGGWLFGARNIPPVSDPVLICGSAAGPIFIVLGSLVYDYRGRWRSVARALLCSTVVAYLATSLGIYILQKYGIGGRWFNGADAQNAIKEGAVLGMAIGVMLGMQVGLATLFYRIFEVQLDDS